MDASYNPGVCTDATQTLMSAVVGKVIDNPDSKVLGANMGPIWGRQDPDGPHVGPMNFPIWEVSLGECLHSCHVDSNPALEI